MVVFDREIHDGTVFYERLSNRRYIKFEVLKMKIKSIFGNMINT